MADQDAIDMDDTEYTIPGQLRPVAELPPLTGPELTRLRFDSIEARLRAIETYLTLQAHTVPEQKEQRVVLMRWRCGRLIQESFIAAHIKPDTVAAAIGQLRNDAVTWVLPVDVSAVLAGVLATET